MEAYKGEHLSNSIVYGFKHITKKDGMCVIKVSFSQQGWFHGSKVEWNTTDCGNRMGYKKPFIPQKVTAPCNILTYTLNHSISLVESIVVYHHLGLQNMSTNRSPLKTVNMAGPGGPFGTQQRREDNSKSSENSSRTSTGKDSWCGKQTNQYQRPDGYGYPPLQWLFPCALQFHQHPPFNITHNSQPTTSAR